MTGNSALGLIKNVAAGTLRVAAGATGTVTGMVKQTLAGRHPHEQEPRPDTAARDDAPEPEPAARAAAEPTRPTEDSGDKNHPEPVNVVEKLGLDPAPVPKPKPPNSIDGAADPDAVDATPADVAGRVDPDDHA